ncbi:unnamed protein product [Nesidiocoris tenuis]|uniref:Integrase zinc-binding domain-containing protein n=1 Tax=Nesidiocoris tenuis TaxID=355587 RepID=A0A6H5H0F4_9HEMI|nr:unnamed protein product [Nesidiocoris tenuis]
MNQRNVDHFEYSQEATSFAKLMCLVCDEVAKVMKSNSLLEVLEAIEFFSTAYQFGLATARPVIREALVYVKCKQPGVKEAVAAAYKTLYLNTVKPTPRERAQQIARRLIKLVRDLNLEQKCALEELMQEWMKNNELDSEFVQRPDRGRDLYDTYEAQQCQTEQQVREVRHQERLNYQTNGSTRNRSTTRQGDRGRPERLILGLSGGVDLLKVSIGINPKDGLISSLILGWWENHSGSEQIEQILVPLTRRQNVLREAHNHGYFGRRRTLSLIRTRYYWPGLQRDVKMFCSTCETCAKSGKNQPKRKAPLQQYIVGTAFERLGIDVAGPFPVSNKGNNIFCLIKYSKYFYQLYFTLLEKAKAEVVRSNLTFGLGDLIARFPNIIEPWTSHIYAK